MLISFQEIFHLVVMCAAITFILNDFIWSRLYFSRAAFAVSNMEKMKFTFLVVAPAIVLHEMGHKFIALALGLKATFYASFPGLAIGIFLRLIQAPFIMFVPGFVSTMGGTPLQHSMVAFAGPLVNLLLWVGSTLVLKSRLSLTHNQRLALHITKQINIFLFFFNMIPFAPFDGGHVVNGLINTFS